MKKERSICNKITYGYTKLFILILLIIYLIVHIGLGLSLFKVNKDELMHKRSVWKKEIERHIKDENNMRKKEKRNDWKIEEEEMIKYFLENEYNSYLKFKIDDETLFQSTDRIGIDIPIDENPNQVMLKFIKGRLYIMINAVEEFTIEHGEDKGKEFTAYYQIIKNIDNEKNYFRFIFILIGVADILGIIMVLLLGKWLSKRLLTPINAIIDTAGKIGGDDLNKRIKVSNAGDELTKMGDVLNEMIERLENSFRKQSKFVSDASHELRTPLSIIQGYIEILDGWGKKDPVILNESVESIKEEVFNMKNLIEKLLFLARGESSSIKLNKTEIDVEKFTQKVVRDAQIVGVNHNVISTKAAKAFISADENMILQCLRAIIDNSIKYTPENKSVEINSYIRENNVIFEVKDNGIGMPEGENEKIFDRFYRIDESRTKDTGGNGLGLAIVKSIIRLHNGEIEVESEINRGTIVRLLIKKIEE